MWPPCGPKTLTATYFQSLDTRRQFCLRSHALTATLLASSVMLSPEMQKVISVMISQYVGHTHKWDLYRAMYILSKLWLVGSVCLP